MNEDLEFESGDAPDQGGAQERTEFYCEILDAIKGLSFIANQMRSLHLNAPAHIITHARDDLMDWAINVDIQDISKDRYISETIFGSGLLLAMDLIAQRASIEDKLIRKKVLQCLREIRTSLDASYKNNLGEQYATTKS